MADILVVEDDQSMNSILVETLTDEGHDVRNAFQAKKGIELGKERHIDLVITDVRLPDMDGVEALREMQKLQPSARFIVITGYASADTPIRAIRLGVDDYLCKPFSLAYLLRAVDRVLHQEEKRSRHSSLFRAIIPDARKKKRDRKLEYMVYARQEAFRGLLVGVRSGYLGLQSAYTVYAILESLEREFRHLLNVESPHELQIRAVSQRYNELLDKLSGPNSGEAVKLQEKESLPRATFEPLFTAIKKSDIDLEDLLYAPLLRSTPDERFETLPQLLELKKRVWPNRS